MPLDKLLQSGNKSGSQGSTLSTALTGALSGAAGGAVVSAFTNKKSARKLLKAGGLVALGGVAWHAFKTYRDNQGAAGHPPVDQPSAVTQPAMLAEADFDAVVAGDGQGALLIIEAMIVAGYADGHLTDLEQRRIWQQALDQGLPGDALAELKSLLENPSTMQQVVSRANNLETRIEVYTASALVIDQGCEVGETYLQQLATALQLPPPLVAALQGEGTR